MDSGIIIVLVILGATVIMLVFDVVRIDIVAIGCMLALGWTGILNPQEMFSGFSSNAVIAMLSVMILGRGIARTGIMDEFSRLIISKAGTRKRNLVGAPAKGKRLGGGCTSSCPDSSVAILD